MLLAITFKGKTVATDLTEEQVYLWYFAKLKDALAKKKDCQYAIGVDGLVISDENNWLEWQTIEGRENGG